MSTSAAQASAFYTEALRDRTVWGIRDSGGFPAPLNGSGERAMPFWSKESRVRKIVEQVAAYDGFELVEIPIDVFQERWLPGLEKDGVRVGLNWSGKSATGYDLPAEDVAARLANDKT